MGFPQDIRSLEGLNKLLDELEAEIEEERLRELEEQRHRQERTPATDEPADQGRAAAVMKFPVRIALDYLRCEVQAQAFAYRAELTHPGERHAVLMAMTARENHMIAVAREAQTPDELRAALIADGTLPAGYEWPAGYVEP